MTTGAAESWTIRRVLGWTTEHFTKKALDSPRLTAEVLLAHSLQVDRVRLYVDLDRPLSKDELGLFRGLIARRAAGEPTQYVTGAREFYNRSFQVDPRVLIPRPETELLVEAVLRAIPKDRECEVLDLCTGSGCIGVTLAAERPSWKVTAVDLSPEACTVARLNATALGVADRMTFLEGDLWQPVPTPARFGLIVSNPPYIASGEIDGLSTEVRSEPRNALDGGPDGLALMRRIIEGAKAFLIPGGLLALEMGDEQGNAVRQLLLDAGFADARIEKDLARHDRMGFATYLPSPPNVGE